MPNQNECDHVVGKCAWNVRRSHIRDSIGWIDQKYKNCPNCGAKIDWDKIKEQTCQTK